MSNDFKIDFQSNSGSQIFGDNGTINNSTNITINHYEQRLNLKELFEHKNPIREYIGYCVGKFGKKEFNGCVSVTFINVHSDNRFIHDHMHIDVPKEYYENNKYDLFDGNIVRFKAKVHRYPRKDKTIDYTLKIKDIIDAKRKIFASGLHSSKINKYDPGENCVEIINNITNDDLDRYHDLLLEFVTRVSTKLDIMLIGMDFKDCLKSPDFISNAIKTQYFLNTKLNEQCSQDYMLRKLSTESLIDLAKIISNIFISLSDDKEFWLYKHVFKRIADVCNYLQGINKDCSLRNENNREEYNDINNTIKSFGENFNNNDSNRMFNKVRNRHFDFGFYYPEDPDKYNETLCRDLVRMLSYFGYDL
jgi:hypothetical protein